MCHDPTAARLLHCCWYVSRTFGSFQGYCWQKGDVESAEDSQRTLWLVMFSMLPPQMRKLNTPRCWHVLCITTPYLAPSCAGGTPLNTGDASSTVYQITSPISVRHWEIRATTSKEKNTQAQFLFPIVARQMLRTIVTAVSLGFVWFHVQTELKTNAYVVN